MKTMYKQRGITLLELMIVVVIVGILAGIAIPTYQSQVVRSTRSDAQSALLGFAQSMERHYAQNFTYLGAASGGGNTGAPAPTVYTSTTPRDGTAYYNLTIQAASASAYTVRATPIAGTRQDGDGYMELNSLGRRAWDRDNNGTLAAAELTWER